MSWNSAERRRITGQGGDFAIKLIAFIGGGTAAFLGVRDVFGLEGPGWAKLLAGFLCLITTLSLVAVLVQDRWRSRRSRYALAMPAMHKAYFHLRDLLASMERGASEDDFAQFLDRAVTAFARAFSVITASHCRVSVKSLYSIDDSQALDVRADEMSLRSLKVRTLARDEGSVSMIGTSDEDGDYVTDNSDYERLLLRESADRSFFCNDLRKLNPYKNSHWPLDETREYLATIVWPIEKSERLTPQIKDGTVRALTFDVQDFLAIDTLAAGSFRRRFDVDFGAAFADTLYTALKRWRALADANSQGPPSLP